jgi:hypothetical protein
MSLPGGFDLVVRPWAESVTTLLVGALLLLGVRQVWWRARDLTTIGAAIAFSLAATATSGRNILMRWLPIVPGLSLGLRIPRRLHNTLGAQLLVGVPFLTLIAVRGFDDISRITWYTIGDDWWVFQRFAYRIYLEGYWLEGGEPAFWFQPFYRWIAGALHMIFGDSSIGELVWDGACAWAGALFAFHVTRVIANFKWGLAAAIGTLLLMTVGPGWYLFGRGLSELTSAGLIYAAALWLLRGRTSPKHVVIAGVCVAIAFFTRLNNLPFALAVAAFSLPIRQPAGDWFKWRAWWPKVSRPAFAGLILALTSAVALFSLRTYYYTGSINALSGTQAGARSVWQTTTTGETPIQNVIGSVLQVLTMNDGGRFDPRSIPIILGLLVAILALCGVRRLRQLPLNVSLLCLAGITGAFVARGSAYPGRFSIHLIPVTVALCVSAAALLWRREGERRTTPR